MSRNPSRPCPLLLTNPVEELVDSLGRQVLLMRCAAALATSAQIITDTPAPEQNAQKPDRFSVLPRSDGWQDILMEDSFVFKTPEPANEGGQVGPGLAHDVLTLSFQRKTPFKGG